MITIITGKPGVGKTALNTFFCEMTYIDDREWLLKSTRESIRRINEKRLKPLTEPDEPPIFTNYEVRMHVGYKKYYEPYFVNPFYLGFQNDKLKVQYLPPNSRIFISEAQRYYNSRKSQTLPDWVSRWYEMHRHYGIEIFMDVQRGKLIDLNIRELCKKFIEVQSMENEKDDTGWIVKSTWHCREFQNSQDYDAYLNGEESEYEETTYVYEGNIFDSFNSTSCFNEFVPSEGEDFRYLTYKGKNSVTAGEPDSEYYAVNEPKGYRGTENKKPNKEEKNGQKSVSDRPDKGA